MSDVLTKSSRVARWGHSAAVRLSTAALEKAHLQVDDTIEVIARDDEIVIRKVQPRPSMDELLARFDAEKHRHAPMLDFDPAGVETA